MKLHILIIEARLTDLVGGPVQPEGPVPGDPLELGD